MPSPRNPGQRVKGQEVSLLFTQDGQLLDTITDIQNFNHDLELELIVKGYLGEKTNRKDEVFNGVKGTFSMHLSRNQWFAIQARIVGRAKRELPDIVFNITQVYAFPDGTTTTVVFPDVKFGPQTTDVASRNEYVSVKAEFGCDDYVQQAA
jgi:hypothetical protein